MIRCRNISSGSEAHIAPHLPPARFSKLFFGRASMNTRTKGILAYLLIAFGIAWINWEIVLRHGFSVSSLLNYRRFLCTSHCRFRRAEMDLSGGFRRRRAEAQLAQMAILSGGMALAAGAGGMRLLFWPPFSDLASRIIHLRGESPIMIHAGISPSKLGHPWLLVAFLPIQAILATPVLFGEEFGWRGYLQPKLFPGSPCRERGCHRADLGCMALTDESSRL